MKWEKITLRCIFTLYFAITIYQFLIFFSHDWVNLFGLSLCTCKSYCIIWQLLHSNCNILISDPAAFSLSLVLRLRSNKDDTWEIFIHSENMRTSLHPQNTCFALWPEVLDYSANMSWCEIEFWLISLSKISDHPRNSTICFGQCICLPLSFVALVFVVHIYICLHSYYFSCRADKNREMVRSSLLVQMKT